MANLCMYREIDHVKSCDLNVRSCDPNVWSCDLNVRSCDPNVWSCDPNVRSCDPNVIPLSLDSANLDRYLAREGSV